MNRTEYELAFMAFNRGLLEASKTHRPVTEQSSQAEKDEPESSLSRGGLVASPHLRVVQGDK